MPETVVKNYAQFIQKFKTKEIFSPIDVDTYIEEMSNIMDDGIGFIVRLIPWDKEWNFKMEKNNIEVRPLWKPMHLQPIYKDSPSYINGVSEDLFNRGLCLPSGTNMKIDDLERVIKCINQLYEI